MRNADQIRLIYAAFWRDDETFEPRDFFEAGDTVTVPGRNHARVRKSGGVFDGEWAHIFTLRGGKLEAFRECYDTKAVAAAPAP
jgi:uncharacterized protein